MVYTTEEQRKLQELVDPNVKKNALDKTTADVTRLAIFGLGGGVVAMYFKQKFIYGLVAGIALGFIVNKAKQ